MKSSIKNNLFFSVILLICMFALTLLSTRLPDLNSNSLLAVFFTLYFVIFPCLSGIMLKVVVNNVKSALIIISLCVIRWSVGNTAFSETQPFFLELLINMIIIPITMFFYFIAYLVINSKKKVVSKILASISSLVLALVFWGGTMLFLELASFGNSATPH